MSGNKNDIAFLGSYSLTKILTGFYQIVGTRSTG